MCVCVCVRARASVHVPLTSGRCRRQTISGESDYCLRRMCLPPPLPDRPRLHRQMRPSVARFMSVVKLQPTPALRKGRCVSSSLASVLPFLSFLSGFLFLSVCLSVCLFVCFILFCFVLFCFFAVFVVAVAGSSLHMLKMLELPKVLFCLNSKRLKEC